MTNTEKNVLGEMEEMPLAEALGDDGRSVFNAMICCADKNEAVELAKIALNDENRLSDALEKFSRIQVLGKG